jgi:hypothetical protein
VASISSISGKTMIAALSLLAAAHAHHLPIPDDDFLPGSLLAPTDAATCCPAPSSRVFG